MLKWLESYLIAKSQNVVFDGETSETHGVKCGVPQGYILGLLLFMCGVEGKRRLCDLNVTNSSPALATRYIRCVLLVNSPNKLNLLSWLLIYLCNE